MKSWRTLERRVLLDRSPFLAVEEHTVALPDGRVIPDWTWLVTPDFANAVALTPEDRLVCFRQTKYAIEGLSLSIPGGFLEPGEDPCEAARRELREETGYESDDWRPLGSYAVDANRGVGRAHFFLARNARRRAPTRRDDLEEQELLLLTREDAATALRRGEFRALAWSAALALALLSL